MDLDGTVYLGEKLITGADLFLDYLKENGIHHYFLSITSETDLFVLDRAKCVSHIFNGRQEGHSDDDP